MFFVNQHSQQTKKVQITKTPKKGGKVTEENATQGSNMLKDREIDFINKDV